MVVAVLPGQKRCAIVGIAGFYPCGMGEIIEGRRGGNVFVAMEMGFQMAVVEDYRSRSPGRPFGSLFLIVDMDASSKQYDVVVAGGGLAGLALSIQLARAGYSVALFEKETYPYHKVCGEYISLESWNFLEELGLPLSDWNLPVIRSLLLSAPNGRWVQQELPLGGFGISRYKIDAAL